MRTSLLSKLERVIHEIASLVTLERVIFRLERWLDHRLKVDVYALHCGELIASRGTRPQQRISIGEIRTWQVVYIGGGDPIISIELISGRTFDWSDKYENLFRILQKEAPEREQPVAYV